MKLNRIAYIALATLTLAGSGCSLDRNPLDTYSDVTEGVTEQQEEVVFADRAAVDSYLKAMYERMRGMQEYGYVDRLLIAESHSDNAYAGTTGAEVVPYEDNSIEGSNSVLARDWNAFLNDAAYATKMIQNIDKVADGSLSAEQQNQYAAQARIFRAITWFDMVRIWGNIPVITTTAGNITAENVEEMYGAYFPSQNGIEAAYKAIEEDLMFAAQYAPEVTADRTVFSRGVAYAYLAKMYAEKPLRDYAKVIEYADKCAQHYALADRYGDIWNVNDTTFEPVRNNRETILEAHFMTGSGNWCVWMFGNPVQDPGFWFDWAKWITPSRDLCKLYDRNGDTERYQQSVAWYACKWSNYYPADNYAFMNKCRSAYSSLIRCRFADILLLKAEALIANGDLGGAAAVINQIRTRAKLPNLSAEQTAGKDALLNAYLDERRMELALEGERWYDLCRLNKVEEVMNAVYRKDSGRHAQRSPFNANSYLMPIPQGAIDQNSNLVQNPGY